MGYPVKQVARMAGVSVRTLHHYDAIGLLRPARVGRQDVRHYGEGELPRLQQILFYRELDLPLERIRKVLDSEDFDTLAALAEHRRRLGKEARRLELLLRTIDRTIEHLKGETAMSEEAFYEGFDPQRQAAYEAEMIERYGEGCRERIEESHRRMRGWTKEDYAQVSCEFDAVHRALVELIEQGAAPADAAVQAVVARHHAVISRFYTPTREVYAGLGTLYVDHPEFRKMYDAHDPRLAPFMQQAMVVYAERNLE